MKSPKVSVIIPVFNAEKTIGGILDKLINQDYKNIEVIAVNDGSKDDSLKVIKDISTKDKRILIVDQKNAGVSAARNVGIGKATGEFITFIDADDDFSEELIKELVAASSDDIDFVMCGHCIGVKDFTSQEALIRGRDAVVGYVLRSLLTKNLLYGPYCKLFNRGIIMRYRIKFPVSVGYGEDTIFNLEYLNHAESIVNIQAALYSYNFSSTGLASHNALNVTYRKARTNALRDYIHGVRSFSHYVIYLTLRLRWIIAFLKTKWRAILNG